ncbi:MAG: hypothetical protein ONB14_03295 [candidate division KSB1 bacterium]|nr:hypothetical protein [candidate division KSB1 bacterium]MDZ7413500.1 hypothetical protein [candidate division KSB1 bacterium]
MRRARGRRSFLIGTELDSASIGRVAGWLIVAACALLWGGPLYAQWTNLDWKLHNVGKVRQLVTNMGTLDDTHENVRAGYPGLLYCEMPPGSNEEHVYQGGIWIGAITPSGDTLVSVSRTHFTPHEFFPTAEPWDTVWVVTKGDTVDIPYWPRYAAVSDQDFVCRYSDYNILNVTDHTPMYLDVIQWSYAWSSPPLDEFIVFNYNVMPTRFPLREVYVGFWLHGEIGNNDAALNFLDEHTYFFPEQFMAVGEDNAGGDDGTAISPIGIKVLYPADSTLEWTFKWYNHEDLAGWGRDPVRYRLGMASGEIMQNRPDIERAHISIAFGPFRRLEVGDTLHFEIGEVFGMGMAGLMKNAKYLEFLRDRRYRVPFPPPRPPLRVYPASHRVTLSWKPLAGEADPEKYHDPYRGDHSPQPFEGYRVYKSTVSAQGPWTLLAEYDIPGNRYGQNTGLAYEYTDVGLVNNVEYYYSVTAFSKPDSVTNFPSQESSVTANAKRVVPGTPPPERVGQVAVVPNPYRGDVAYHEYNPQWEKPAGTRKRWMEQDRRVQFINLPAHCTIKVYTLAGDLVTTIEHDDATRGYEDWNLTSAVGQAISSGIYLFSVEDKHTGEVQVGKFVVIK